MPPCRPKNLHGHPALFGKTDFFNDSIFLFHYNPVMEQPPLVNPPPVPTGNEKGWDKVWSILCHLSCIIELPIILPLILFLVKKDEPYVRENAREALNCHISVLIYTLCCIPLAFIGIGVVIMMALAVALLIFSIIAAVKASDGQIYRYPLILRLV